mmetsp:Transcript_15563/g.35876  ORF Transcript_15563/g.35876 Transcript_15563/m.35876 type:complete len:89 (-) Transcript_15563:86-352(-)
MFSQRPGTSIQSTPSFKASEFLETIEGTEGAENPKTIKEKHWKRRRYDAIDPMKVQEWERKMLSMVSPGSIILSNLLARDERTCIEWK